MADKFARTNFFKQNNINNVVENDLPFNAFNSFKFKRPRTFYTIKRQDVSRPELISYKVYGSINYWWIILKLNNIDDPFNDLEIGKTIQLPSQQDIEDFYIQTRRKNL
jgi:serine protease inhibitor